MFHTRVQQDVQIQRLQMSHHRNLLSPHTHACNIYQNSLHHPKGEVLRTVGTDQPEEESRSKKLAKLQFCRISRALKQISQICWPQTRSRELRREELHNLPLNELVISKAVMRAGSCAQTILLCRLNLRLLPSCHRWETLPIIKRMDYYTQSYAWSLRVSW